LETRGGGGTEAEGGEGMRKALEGAEKEYARQKELEKAILGKRKAVEMEESGEEMEKEPEGSNKKVSEIFHSDYSD
jgi:hypothetical protein